MTDITFGITLKANGSGLVGELKVTEKQVDELSRSFNRNTFQAKKMNTASKQLTGGIRGLIAPLLTLTAITAGLREFTGTARQFDILSAGLETATGSAENAAGAFAELEKFAATTPFLLEQSVDAFTKLVNLGLTPSERALRSYGNTSAAMGKDLTQLIEAVADAATGEFERLKEFGIKARSEGDNVSFTFRGVTTTVRKNAAEIEGYLIALGENEFAGAMAKRMATLDGAISNLGDTWDETFRTISERGAGELLETTIRDATDALGEFNDSLASGQFEAYIVAFAGKFDAFGGDIADTLNILNQLFNDWGIDITEVSRVATESLGEDFKNLPENVRAFIQLMTVEVAAFVDKTAAYGTEILENLKFWEDESFDLEGRLAGIDSARDLSIAKIIEERDASINSFEQQIIAADDLRKKYDELQAAGGSLDLGQFKTGGDSSTAPTASALRAAAKEAKELQSLLDDLYPEDQAAREFQDNQVLLNNALKEGTIDADKHMQAMLLLETQYYQTVNAIEQANLAATQFARDQAALAKNIEDAVSSSASTVEDAWVSLFQRGKFESKAFFDAIIADIARLQYQTQIAGAANNLLNSFFSSLGSLFASPASNGATNQNNPAGGFYTGPNYTGPFPQTAPRAASRPVGSVPQGGGASVQITQSFDFRNADASVLQQLRAEAGRIQRATENSVFQKINRGGGAARVVGRR